MLSASEKCVSLVEDTFLLLRLVDPKGRKEELIEEKIRRLISNFPVTLMFLIRILGDG